MLWFVMPGFKEDPHGEIDADRVHPREDVVGRHFLYHSRRRYYIWKFRVYRGGLREWYFQAHYKWRTPDFWECIFRWVLDAARRAPLGTVRGIDPTAAASLSLLADSTAAILVLAMILAPSVQSGNGPSRDLAADPGRGPPVASTTGDSFALRC